jgi:hypothetical protein
VFSSIGEPGLLQHRNLVQWFRVAAAKVPQHRKLLCPFSELGNFCSQHINLGQLRLHGLDLLLPRQNKPMLSL